MMHYLITFFLLIFSISQTIVSPEPFSQDTNFTPEQLDHAKKIIESYQEVDMSELNAEDIFKQNCSACHGRKGGLGLAGATNLKTSTLELDHRVAMIYFGRNKMQSYKDVLSEKEIFLLASYLENLRK